MTEPGVDTTMALVPELPALPGRHFETRLPALKRGTASLSDFLLGLLIMAHHTLFHAQHEHGVGHLTLVAALEFVGAMLLLIPRTLKVGGVALLAVLIPGFIVHLTRGEWELRLLIYAAGVWFVVVHGAAWGRPTPTPGVAA